MAFKTFVDGVALPASDLNTYLMKQAVIVCTSGTRPASPIEGMQIYETDTDRQLVYTTATTTWRQPWNMPWGRLGHATSTTTQASLSTEADVTGMTVTWTAVANRYYKITGFLLPQTTGAITVNGFITDAANTHISGIALTYPGAGFGNLHLVSAPFAVSSGSVTYKLRISTASGTASTYCGAGQPHIMIVEDVGPSGAPA